MWKRKKQKQKKNSKTTWLQYESLVRQGSKNYYFYNYYYDTKAKIKMTKKKQLGMIFCFTQIWVHFKFF